MVHRKYKQTTRKKARRQRRQASQKKHLRFYYSVSNFGCGEKISLSWKQVVKLIKDLCRSSGRLYIGVERLSGQNWRAMTIGQVGLETFARIVWINE